MRRITGASVALVVAGVLLAFAAPAGSAAAPPPANDARAKAQILKLPAQVDGTTVGATAEATDPQCGAKVRETVWYRFTRTLTGTIVVSFQGGGQLDAVVSAHELVNGDLKLLKCAASDAKGRAGLVFEVHPEPKKPVVVLLEVGQVVNSDPGTFKLAVEAPPRPGNDELAGATVVAPAPAKAAGTTVGATSDEGDPGCVAGPSVWYRLTTPTTQHVTARLHAVGDLEARLCAVQKVRSQLRAQGEAVDTNDKGDARFEFDAHGGDAYYVVVAQTGAAPGEFSLALTAPPRPANDERAGAVEMHSLPASLTGTTVGATADPADPECAPEATVWYGFTPPANTHLVMRLRAAAGSEPLVCVFEQSRKGLRMVATHEADGSRAVDFDVRARTRYLVVVSHGAESHAGAFALSVLVPERPPVPPGEPLAAARAATGRLDPLLNEADAWAAPLARGVTYRIAVGAPGGGCVQLSLFGPNTRSFAQSEPIRDYGCTKGVHLFTPGPDGGGVYSLALKASKSPSAYRLLVMRAAADDLAPGILLGSAAVARGTVSSMDPLDLYRFDVKNTSDVRLLVTARREIDVRLLGSGGRTIREARPGVKLIRVLGAGTYFVAVTTGPMPATYSITVVVRNLTRTGLTANGAFATTVGPGAPVTLRTTTIPTTRAGHTRLQVDFYDLAHHEWVFRRAWSVRPGSAVPFVPDAVGSWRARATFLGSAAASPSRSAYRTITVHRAVGRHAGTLPVALRPGRLGHAGVRGTVTAQGAESLAAWVTPFARGVTYRVNLVSFSGSCLDVSVFRRSPAAAEGVPSATLTCEEGGTTYGLFTPGPDGGGLYTLVVAADTSDGAVLRQNYRLQVAPAGPDDTGPGLPVRSGRPVDGMLAPLGVDVVDLYHFDVTGPRSAATLRLRDARTAQLDLTLMDEGGATVASGGGTPGPLTLGVALRPGRYYAAVHARGHRGGAYRLSVLVRAITHTSLATSSRTVPRGGAVDLVAGVRGGDGGRVEFQLDRLDPLQGWVYWRSYRARVVGSTATVTWRPPSDGRWRARASFLGTATANPSRSDYRTIVTTAVATPAA